jgi:hypothetical protein
VFGRFCFGGDWRKTAAGLEIVPKDGVRRRLHALLGDGEQQKLHLVLDRDRFASGEPIVLKEDLSEVRFHLESDNPTRHVARLQLSGVPAGTYVVLAANKTSTEVEIKNGQETVIELPMASSSGNAFTVARRRVANR